LPAEKIGIWHCAALLLSQVPKRCTDLDLTLLYILTSGTYSKFVRKNDFLALGVCFPQPCSSAGRKPEFAASRSRLRWGWVFLERTRILSLSGIQFTTHFIKKIVVETKRFVSSTVNVILTRQTCSQRSNRAAESKRRALGNYFFKRIC